MALTPDMDNQIAVHNIDDQGNITGQTGLSRVVANYGNINDMNSFSPELQAAIQGYQNPPPQNSALQGGLGIPQGILDPMQQIQAPQFPAGGGQPVDGSGVGIGNMVMPQPGTPGFDLINSNPFDDPNYRPTYNREDNPYSSLINDYAQSDYFDSSSFDQGFATARPAVTNYDPLFGEVHGGYNPYNTQGFSDFLENSYGRMQDRMQMRDVKSQEFMDKFNTYGDAYNIRFPGENPGMPDFITGGNGQLPGPIVDPNGNIDQGRPAFDEYGQPSMHTPGMQQVEMPNPNYGIDPNKIGTQLPGPIMDPNINPFDPQPSMPDFNTGTGDSTTDIFGAGNNPINNNPITVMPSPITPPGGMNSGHSHGDLLSGIGKLFEQYFPQQGGSTQFNQPGAQPTFDATGNSVSGGQTQSNQVFGNMITPDFGSY